MIQEEKKLNIYMVVTGPFESYAVADGDDGVINGIQMAGHVKICRGWDQFIQGWESSHGAEEYSVIVQPHCRPFP